MLRQSLDSDSAYGDFVIHGNGMPGIQWRSNKGENTNAFDLPFDAPGGEIQAEAGPKRCRDYRVHG